MKQGKSAREECPLWILKTIHVNEKMGFEELVEKGKDCYSRGTVNKYLNEEYVNGRINRVGRRGKYFLTSEGEKWLINNFNSALQEILSALSQNLNQLTHDAEVKHTFRKGLTRISREDFESAKSDARVIFKPFTDLLRSIVVLQLWLQPNYHHLAGVTPWMQLLTSKPPTSELSIEEAEHIVEGNYFLFGPNMAGFIPIPPLPTDEKITVSYLQNAWKFVESLKPKDGPLHPLPFKDPSKDKFKRKEEK